MSDAGKVIGLVQIEVEYYPVGYEYEVYIAKPDEPKNWNNWTELNYEYAVPGNGPLVETIPCQNEGYLRLRVLEHHIQWDVGGTVCEEYPYDLADIIDTSWNDVIDGERVWEETLKRLPKHQDLLTPESRMRMGKWYPHQYIPYTQATSVLRVRFPMIVIAEFSVDDYSGECDADIYEAGVPDLWHIQDIVPKEDDNSK